MELLNYQIEINTEPDKVWSVLWGDISYRQWTSAFTEGSFYVGELEEGNIIKFFDPKNNGMFSKIIKMIPHQEMTFLHLGEIYDGVEVPQDWGIATESYILEETETGTILKIVINTPSEFKTFFEENFPIALQNVKNLSENQF